VLPSILTLPGLGWDVQSYGLLLALAIVLAWVVLLSLGRRDRLPSAPLGTAFVLGVGLGLVAARLAWILQRPAGAPGPAPELFVLGADELAPFAGLVVAGLVAGLHVMRRRVPVVAFFVVAAPAVAAAAIVERLGAWLAGTGFGRYAPTLPWAIRFPPGSPAYAEHQRSLAGLLPAGAEASLPVHPTQLYAMLIAGAALGVGLWLRRRRRFSGQVFLGTTIAYVLGRALVEEWFRADAGGAVLGPFDSAQVSALVLASALGVVLWSRGRLAARRPKSFTPWLGGPWSPKDEPPPRERERAEAGPGAATPAGAGRPSGRAGKGRGKHEKRRKGRR
jgi:phosphatidylglycerol:prolipoprotein diacylglycerol transferase